MSELFDPARHRVFAVNRTYSYRAYVVAATAEEAEATAEAHNDDDRDLATNPRLAPPPTKTDELHHPDAVDLGLAVTPVGLAFPDLGRGAVIAPLRGVHAEHHLNPYLHWTGVAVG